MSDPHHTSVEPETAMRFSQRYGHLGRRGRVACAVALAAILTLTGCTFTPATFSSSSATRTLTVWSYLAGDAENANIEALNKLFAARHPDVEVRTVAIPLGQHSTKLLAAAGTGEGPDVIIGNPVVDFPLLSSANVYADLTKRWREFGDADTYDDEALWRDRGRIYAIHWRFNDFGLWYNKDILDEYNLQVPETVADLEAAMRTIAKDGKYRPLVLPGAPDVQSAWFFMSWLYGAGVTYCNLDSPVTEQVLRMLADWRDKGYLSNDTAALSIEDAFDRLLTGEFAFSLGGNWEAGPIKAEPPSFTIGSTSVPAGKAGSRLAFAGESVGVGRYAAEPDLAWDYLRSAYLSAKGQEITFDNIGAFPPRDDVRGSEKVSGDTLARPFVQALEPQRLVPWPDNPNTGDAQVAAATVFSSMISGEISPKEAAVELRDQVGKAFEDGGGGC